MDFEKDIRMHVLNNLPCNPKFKTELIAHDTRSLLIIYMNWLSRLIEPRPRRVHMSSALMGNPFALDPALNLGLQKLIIDMEQGRDINPHLSDKILSGFTPYDVNRPKKKLKMHQRPDRDLLLADWGIHHFHLETQTQSTGFVNRTGELLFAIIRPDDSYFIDISNHKGWSEQRLLEIIIEEWPDTGIVRKTGARSKQYLTDQQKLNLRKNGYSSSFVYKDEVYMTMSAISTAGTSVFNSVFTNRIWRNIVKLNKTILDDPNYLKQLMQQNQMEQPSDPEWHFMFFPEGGYGLFEKKTGFRIKFKD